MQNVIHLFSYYLCIWQSYQHVIILHYVNVIGITVLASSDFSMLKNYMHTCVCKSSTHTLWHETCFFTDEKFFIPTLPVSNQNNSSRVWVGGKKADIKPARVLTEREKLAQHVMVCFGGSTLLMRALKWILHTTYWPSPYQSCQWLYSTVASGYVFQQDGVPANTAPATKNWLRTNCQRKTGGLQLEALGLPCQGQR